MGAWLERFRSALIRAGMSPGNCEFAHQLTERCLTHIVGFTRLLNLSSFSVLGVAANRNDLT